MMQIPATRAVGRSNNRFGETRLPANIAAYDGLWKFFILLMAIKPFVDILWQWEIVSFAGATFTPTRTTALIVGIVTPCVYLRRRPRNIVGAVWIFAFSLLMTQAVLLAYALRDLSFRSLVDTLLRIIDGYMIFQVFAVIWRKTERLRIMVNVIWLSTLGVNLLSVAVWRTGIFNVNVTAGIERFAGLYNDAGGPSYNAVFSFAFGFFAVELAKRSSRHLLNIFHPLLAVTCIVSAVLLYLAMTKSAFLMLLVFVVMWWGIYKRKQHLIILLVPLAIYVIYTESSVFQDRFANEVQVFVEGDYSEHAIKSLGTGRGAIWMHLLEYFLSLDFHQQLFGTGRGFGAHNQYLSYLLKCGVIGLSCFLLMLASWCNISYQKYSMTQRPEYFFGLVLLIMFMVLGLTGNPFDYTTMLWYVLMILSFIHVPVKDITRNRKFV